MTQRPGMYGDIKVIAGTSAPQLARDIVAYLNTKPDVYPHDKRGRPRRMRLMKRHIRKFSNDNTWVQLNESVRGQDVYIIQTMSRPVNDNLMELLIMLDAVRRDSAGRITTVIPHISYSRSDKKDLPRTPITARLVADMIEVAGADRFMTIELHSGQIQGFFRIPGDVLSSFPLLSDYVVQNLPMDNLTVATTDLGFAKRGRQWSKQLGLPLALIEKDRTDEGVTAQSIVGHVDGHNVLLVDDELDTGSSIVEAVWLLDRAGAREITIAFTHPVFSRPAYANLGTLQERVREIIFTDTLPVPPGKRLPNMTCLSVAPLLGEVIRRAHLGLSVGEMFGE